MIWFRPRSLMKKNMMYYVVTLFLRRKRVREKREYRTLLYKSASVSQVEPWNLSKQQQQNRLYAELVSRGDISSSVFTKPASPFRKIDQSFYQNFANLFLKNCGFLAWKKCSIIQLMKKFQKTIKCSIAFFFRKVKKGSGECSDVKLNLRCGVFKTKLLWENW